MDDEGITEGKRSEGSFSLLDLAIIFIRYRVVIIGITLVAVAIAAAALFLLPALGVHASRNTYTVKYSIQVEAIPQRLQESMGFDPVRILSSTFSSVPIVAEAYANSYSGRVGNLSPEMQNAEIYRLMQSKRFLFEYDSNTQTFLFSMTDGNKDETDAFLARLWSKAEKAINEKKAQGLHHAYGIIKDQLQLFDSVTEMVPASLDAKAALRYEYLMLQYYETMPSFPFENDIVRTVIQVNKQKSRSGIVVLVAFNAFIFAVILSFILNSISALRCDAKSMEKLRIALAKGMKK
jgi:hypothetical protein